MFGYFVRGVTIAAGLALAFMLSFGWRPASAEICPAWGCRPAPVTTLHLPPIPFNPAPHHHCPPVRHHCGRFPFCVPFEHAR